MHRLEFDPHRPSPRRAEHPDDPQHGEERIADDGQGVVVKRRQKVTVDEGVGAAQSSAAGQYRPV